MGVKKLSQIKLDAKNQGWYDWIVEPDGQVHPNNERALLEGCYFDAVAAQKIQDFCVQFLTLPREQGEMIADYELDSIKRRFPSFDADTPAAMKPFAMLKWWHRRVVGQLYGWRCPNGARRYKRGFVTTAKKSGKTTTLAALPLAELLIGGVPEKEIYVVAVTEEQAGYLFKKTLAMAKRSHEIAPLLKFNASTNRIINEKTASVFRTLAAMEGPIHGIQPNLLIMDELHAWYGREIYDALIYGDIRRVDSLRLIITTAGKNESSVAYEELESAKALMDPNDGRYEQDAFAFIAEAGRDPITGKTIPWEWDSLDSVIQANPTLLENPQSLSKIKQELESVKNTPGKKGAWIQLMCNRYTSVAESWISHDRWRDCEAEIPSHEGDPVWLGLDLAFIEDLVALAMVWHSKEPGKIDLKVRFWMPDAEIDDKAHRWQVPQLREWIEQGWIETCPGRVIRNDFLRAAISGVVLNEFGGVMKLKDGTSVAERYSIEELAYDRAGAQELVIQQLGDRDGLPVVDHSQGFLGMSVPSKEFAKRIACQELQHDGNPVMDWMIRHCVIDMDPAGNIKPTKKKSRQKIDGVVASIMAVGRATLTVPKKTVYERRGVLIF
jgi:phage terminase large subunit-like protein